MQGKIYKILSNFYYVKVDDRIIECKAKGVFKKRDIDLYVGDNVLVEPTYNNKGNIYEVLPRKNKLKRPSVANVDKLIILLSIKDPFPDLVLLDKQIIYCLKHNIEPVICITKIDKDTEKKSEQIKEIYKKIGYKVYCISSKEKIGIETFKKEIKGSLCVFAGNSGVGKSTLVNTVFNDDIMKEGNISEKTLRGKHTTRHVEIIEYDDYMIADTPGFSLFELDDITKNELFLYYEEFKRYVGNCEFRDCTHIKEEKCGVKEAVKNGSVEEERYTRYVQIYNELNR